MKIPEWVIRNLEEHGNCYVNGVANNNIEKFAKEVSEEINSEIKIKPISDGNGYVLEKVKNNG